MANADRPKFYPDGNEFTLVMVNPPAYGQPGKPGKKGPYWMAGVSLGDVEHVWFLENDELQALVRGGSPRKGQTIRLSGRGANLRIEVDASAAPPAAGTPAYAPSLGEVLVGLRRSYNYFLESKVPTEQASMLAANAINNVLARGRFDLDTIPLPKE